MSMGVDEELFPGLVDEIDTPPVDEKLKPVLKYVRKLILSPDRMTDEDVKDCYASGGARKT